MVGETNAETPPVAFADVEDSVNAILKEEWENLNADPVLQEYYRSIFDRTGEEGFYDHPDRVRGRGEQPTWSPNEAYIQAHERMWAPVSLYLDSIGLRLEAPFRELFYSSREYQDTETDHRRVFFGQLCDFDGTPRTAFMLTVPHSHDDFRFLVPLQLSISSSSLEHE